MRHDLSYPTMVSTKVSTTVQHNFMHVSYHAYFTDSGTLMRRCGPLERTSADLVLVLSDVKYLKCIKVHTTRYVLHLQ